MDFRARRLQVISIIALALPGLAVAESLALPPFPAEPFIVVAVSVTPAKKVESVTGDFPAADGCYAGKPCMVKEAAERLGVERAEYGRGVLGGLFTDPSTMATSFYVKLPDNYEYCQAELNLLNAYPQEGFELSGLVKAGAAGSTVFIEVSNSVFDNMKKGGNFDVGRLFLTIVGVSSKDAISWRDNHCTKTTRHSIKWEKSILNNNSNQVTDAGEK